MPTRRPDPSDVVDRLRAATRDAHERLDARLNIVETLADPAGRRRLVARFYGLHAGAEPALAAALGTGDGFDLSGRDRTPILERDLSALDIAREEVPLCPVAVPGSAAEALGFLYVLEGSTLGGRIIRRLLDERGQDGRGLAFLDPYGAETGARWRAFLEILRRADARDGTDDPVVRGGIAGFTAAEGWLCAPAEAGGHRQDRAA